MAVEARLLSAPGRPELSRGLVQRLLAATASLPMERVVVVTLEQESPWWAPLLASRPAENILEQPIERGTATGILLAFLRIFSRDPSAEIVIATAGADPEALEELIESRTAFASARRDDRALVARDAGGRFTLCVAPSAAVLRLYRESQPELFASLLDFVRKERNGAPSSLDELYPFLPEVDFDRDVLRSRRGEGRRLSSVPPPPAFVA